MKRSACRGGNLPFSAVKKPALSEITYVIIKALNLDTDFVQSNAVPNHQERKMFYFMEVEYCSYSNLIFSRFC